MCYNTIDNSEQQAEEFINRDLTNIVTPVNVRVLEKLLRESKYPVDKTEFLVNGFTYGFDIGYRGPWKRQDTSHNLPFEVGDKQDLYDKIMKEVKLKRYAGPFSSIHSSIICNHL